MTDNRYTNYSFQWNKKIVFTYPGNNKLNVKNKPTSVYKRK